MALDAASAALSGAGEEGSQAPALPVCASDSISVILPQAQTGAEAPSASKALPSSARCPLQGPVDTHDLLCAKVLFALCGSVFPHPLLLAQQLLGIEDADFPEFQQVCIDCAG